MANKITIETDDGRTIELSKTETGDLCVSAPTYGGDLYYRLDLDELDKVAFSLTARFPTLTRSAWYELASIMGDMT